jgi:hypothetical protein
LLDPKFRLTPALLIGNKSGIHFSTDDIIALETQGYLRWNFLRFSDGKIANRKTSRSQDIQTPFPNTTDLFIQGGVGFLGAFKGTDIRDSRSSVLFDLTAGVTIPVGTRWHIEPSIRAGYPFLGGAAITIGYRLPVPQRIIHDFEYIEVIRTLPPNEIIKSVLITQVEYIIFAPDTSRFNYNIEHNARSLNELVIKQISDILKENSNLRVRIEGHANPVHNTQAENEILFNLSSARANEVAGVLMNTGVREEQIIIAAYGTTRTVASDHDHWDMNRRVELILVQIDTN